MDSRIYSIMMDQHILFEENEFLIDWFTYSLYDPVDLAHNNVICGDLIYDWSEFQLSIGNNGFIDLP